MLLIPQKVNVGFQDRSDTYSGKLAYVVYFDEKNKLRKEGSWNSWRSKSIPNEILDNVPTSGFVLNKKAGGERWGWNPRQSYIRVFDPRGWEIEITPENLMYILENTNSYKGKGLEGEFVYSWQGKDLVLLPVEDPDYEKYKAHSEAIFLNNFVGARDLIIGHKYKFKNQNELVFMGKYNVMHRRWVRFDKSNQVSGHWSNSGYESYPSAKKEFVFFNHKYQIFETFSSITKQIMNQIDDEKVEDYVDILDKIEKESKIITTNNQTKEKKTA